MLDLSNLNGEPDFRRVYAAGQRRVELKVSEGLHFDDRYYAARRRRAQAAGLKTAGYHFGHPWMGMPREEARHFARKLGRLVPGKDLRPCLDFEEGPPSALWALAFIAELKRIVGVAPILYSYPDFLRRAHFRRPPAPLWLASFGRNDGREHPFSIPPPWRGIVAHQYSSRARVAGVPGLVDISHVFVPRALELPKAGL